MSEVLVKWLPLSRADNRGTYLVTVDQAQLESTAHLVAMDQDQSRETSSNLEDSSHQKHN